MASSGYHRTPCRADGWASLPSPRQPCFLPVNPTLRLAPASPAVRRGRGGATTNKSCIAFWAAGDCYQLSWSSDSPASLGSPWVWVVFDLPLGCPLPGPVSGGGLSLNKGPLFSSPLLSGSFQDFPELAFVSHPPLCPPSLPSPAARDGGW